MAGHVSAVPRVRACLAIGASVAALAVAQSAAAQAQPCPNGQPGPVCTIENAGTIGPVVGSTGNVTVVNNSGTISGDPAISKGGSAALLVDNQDGGVITGTGGTAILATPGLQFRVINSGTINGDVVYNDAPAPNPFTGPLAYYVSDGGILNGNLQLGTSGFAGANFLQRGADDGVTGTISAGAGLDIYTRIHETSQSLALGQYALPATFEIEGYYAEGAGTVLTLTGAGTSISLGGEGSVVNNATIGVVSTAGLYPAGVEVIPAAISYFQPNSAVFRREQIPIGQPQSFFSVGWGNALASFTNNGTVNGDILLATAAFINTGEINLATHALGSAVTGAADTAFLFDNQGTIEMSADGPRLPFAGIISEFDSGVNAALRLRSAINTTQASDVTIRNGGTIIGGLDVNMAAADFVFENTGLIEGIDIPGEYQVQGLTLGVGELNLVMGQDPETHFDAETASILNSATGSIDHGFEAYLSAFEVTFRNEGFIAGSDFNPDALFVEQYLDADDVDATSFAFVNTGEFEGNVGLETETSIVSISNSGMITGGGFDVNPTTFPVVMFGGKTAFEIDNETIGDSTFAFVNTGSIVNTSHAGSGVTIEVDAGEEDDVGAIGNANLSVINAGTISATGGATIVTQQFANWLQPGQFLVNPLAALAVDASDVSGASAIAIDNQAGGVIRAGGAAHVVSPNGYAPIAASAPGVLTVALYATGKTINITNSGIIEGGAGTTLLPNAVFDDIDFYDSYLAGAIQTAGDEYGPDEIYVASVDHLVNTATGTIVGSIDLGGNDDRIDNAGSITGDVFLRDGNDIFASSGTLTGNLFLGTGDDLLELTPGSIINGLVDLGEGQDAVRLTGAGGNAGQVAATVNAELLDVASGSWRASATESEYDLVRIAAAARLTVAEDANGNTAIATSHVELDGRLDLDLVTDTEAGDFASLLIEGAGTLHLVGEATVLVDDATGLQHTGGTFVDNGELRLATVFGGNVTTSGDGVFELAAGGDFTGDLVNNGVFRFSRTDDYSFAGNFSGAGALEKYGDGTLTFAGLYGFVGTTSIFGGHVAFTGQLAEDTQLNLNDGVVDLSNVESREQTIAQLAGTGGTLQLGETALVIQQIGDSVYAGSITGIGALIKDGAGDLKLDGDGAGFTGTGTVNGGTLSINGSFENAGFEVNPGGKLGGNGTVGDTNVQGGTLGAGNSIGTLTVAGNLAFTSNSVLEVEVDPAGNADLIHATGTATLGGAAVNVLAESGAYRPLTDYTILTADGGVSGTFGSVEVNLAFLDPSLSYSANAVTLRLLRNDLDFAAFAETPNQGAIAGLIESFGYGNTLYNETLTLIDADVAVSFASLTGEVYPAYASATIETAEMLRRQTAGKAGGEGVFAWATGLHSQVSSGSDAGEIALDGKGVAGGFGFGANGFTASAGLGAIDQDGGGSDLSDGKVTFAIGRLAYASPAGFAASAGAQFGWVDGSTRRQTRLGAIDQAVTGGVDGDYLQLFGELGYKLAVGSASVEPFAGVSHVSLQFDGLSETGASTALVVSAINRDVTFAEGGVRFSGEAGGVRPFASASYRRAWGDRASLASVGFAGGTGTAMIEAAPIARSAVALEAGLSAASGPVEFEAGYRGTVSGGFDSHGLNAGFRFRF